MVRTIMLLVLIPAFLGCASAPPRPAPASAAVDVPGPVVDAPALAVAFRLPHDRWSAEHADGATVAIAHARGARVTLATRPIERDGFIATVDAVRRDAMAAGCALRGTTRHVTDQFGRRAVVSARRTADGGVEDGEITLLQLDGREDGIVIEAWWPETPSSWTRDDVHDIVDSIRPLPGR